MSSLLLLKFWFSLNPLPMQSFFSRILLLVFLFFTIVGLLSKFISTRKNLILARQKIADKLSRPFLSTGLIGLLLLFFESERVIFLRSRFFFLLLTAWFIYSLVRAAQYIIKKLPQEEAERAKRAKLEKYLPR